MKSGYIMFALLVLMLMISCGAGDDLNDTATCAEFSQIETFCHNKIDPDNAKDDEDTEILKIACEAKLSSECIACIFENPCNVAEKKTPLAYCITDDKCFDPLAVEE